MEGNMGEDCRRRVALKVFETGRNCWVRKLYCICTTNLVEE